MLRLFPCHRTSGSSIITFGITTIQLIGTSAAFYRVIATTAFYIVIAGETPQLVITAVTGQIVIVGRPLMFSKPVAVIARSVTPGGSRCTTATSVTLTQSSELA